MEEEKAIRSSAFAKAMKVAGNIAGTASKALGYIGKASVRLRLLEMAGNNWDSLKQDFLDLLAMLTAYYKGTYKKVPLGTITKALAGVIYLVFVIDLIPDFIPFIGFVDDIAVIGWVLKSIADDIELFRTWRNAQAIDVSENQEEEEHDNQPA